MRVLLDENLDRRLKKSFDEELEVLNVIERGWSEKQNGDSLIRMVTRYPLNLPEIR